MVAKFLMVVPAVLTDQPVRSVPLKRETKGVSVWEKPREGDRQGNKQTKPGKERARRILWKAIDLLLSLNAFPGRPKSPPAVRSRRRRCPRRPGAGNAPGPPGDNRSARRTRDGPGPGRGSWTWA